MPGMFLMNHYSGNEFFNVGSGYDLTIKELAELVKEVVGFEGDIVFDTSKPDGMPQKLLDVTKLTKAGWSYSTELKKGLSITYQWYLEHYT